jgi:hypothetical protein
MSVVAFPGIIETGARFSPNHAYRYELWRHWDASKRAAMFLMLNPSTADETKNDPTVERCQRYAARWGFGGLVVCNIFALRATDPAVMKAHIDPVGTENDAAIINNAVRAGIVMCAWGNHGRHLNRSREVMALLEQYDIRTWCLTTTASGEPGHPLYLRNDVAPKEYKGADHVIA